MTSLAPALADPNGVYLVLDAGDGRILHASAAAHALAEALAARDGTALARQAAQAAPLDGTARLARLRLDPRRIAPPVVCLLSGAALEDGTRAILLVPTLPVLLPRARPVPQAARDEPLRAAEPQPPASPAPGMPRRGDRFLWRSDAAHTLMDMGRASALARFVGRSWDELAGAGRITGAEALLAALRERRTFRAIPATLHLDGHAPLPVALSGAPSGRGGADFAGFGLIRGDLEPSGAPEAASPPPDERDTRGADDAPTATPELCEADAADPSLSTDEHAAFREIARALGARYAGDEDAVDPEPGGSPGTQRPPGGAVMPFPGAQPEPLPAHGGDPDAAPPDAAALLAALPVPTLVHRGGIVLAANPPLFDLTGFADLAALREAGIGRLFRGVTPEAPGKTAVEAADGRARPVEIARGACTWAGEPATCLVLRPLGEDDAAGALEAERLAREAQAARALRAEAALDAVEAGVVTLDGAGRVVALNRAAAALFGADAREVVGGSFADLLDAASAPALASAVRDGAGPVSVSDGARTLRVSPAGADGRRVAVLDPAGRADTEAAARSGTVLGRLDRELRAPMRGVVETVEAMLQEPFGPLGDGRYRSSLLGIQASGERMLERMAELLDIAAVEAGALELDLRPLALNEVVAGCVARLQPEAARGRIVLRTSFSPELATLEADERSVTRAASLVIEHAIRRSAAGGQVIVSTGAAERAEVALRVRDTAAARLDPEDAQPGPPADGLALPRALVEANGGQLRLARRAEDDGTLVEIILPAKRA